MPELQRLANVESNLQLYKKAYLMEFVDEGGSVLEVFTFSIPPESEELTYSQRKTETKTFGGLHVDEYGTDAVKLVLNGSTVNQELKRIYKAGKGDIWLTGEEEIYHLRDLIEKYKSVESLQKNTKVYLYDLSKVAIWGGNSTIKNYWQFFQGDFKIRRSSDKPFTYKYTLEGTGVPPEKEAPYFKFPELTEKKVGELKTIIGGLIGAIDFIDGINAKVNNVLAEVKKVSDLIKTLGNVMSYATNTLTGIIDSVGDTAAGFMDATTTVIEGVNSIVALPRTIEMKALNVGIEIQNATKSLVKATDDLGKTCRGAFSSETYRIPDEVLKQFDVNDKEINDIISGRLNEAENISNELAAAAKSADIPDVMIGNPDPATGKQRIVLSYGHTCVTLKETDSLESLAMQYFGNPDRAVDIAVFNGVASLDDLQPGDSIRIPIPKQQANINNRNRIFSKREDRDNYGKDILLTLDGRFVFTASGDYALTDGVNNLSQSILLRLKENINKRIRLIAYGIRTNISDPVAGKAYIVSSVDMTIMGDPRVREIKDIRFKANGNAMWIKAIYNDINKTEVRTEGRV